MKNLHYKEVYVFKEGKLTLEMKTLENLIIEFEPLAKKVVNDICRKTNNAYCKEDLLQNANIEIIGVFNRYDKTFNVTFAHFLKQSLFLSLFKKTNLDIQKNNRNIHLNECIAHCDVNDNFETVESIIDMSALLNKIPIRDREILKYKIKGFTQAEISKTLKISQSQVSKTLKNIRSKLKNAV